MTEFLLLFSLILHGVTFLIMIYFYKRFSQYQDVDNMKRTVREIEDLFEAYLMELKDENKKFLNIVTKNGNTVIEQNRVVDTEEELKDEKQEVDPVAPNKNSSSKVENEAPNVQNQDENQYEPESIELEDAVEEPSIQSTVLLLYQQGLSVEEIAKKLNMGKTEVELIIKFHAIS
jgi:DNA-directed RNA polymerase specialized sigma24 family protein